MSETPIAQEQTILGYLYRRMVALGDYCHLMIQAFSDFFRHGVERRTLIKQIVVIGYNSIPIVLITALFTGMVLSLQTAYGLYRFGAKNYVGNVVSLGLVRELGPVLTAVMLCGRVGASIAAEIASMVSTEQVDAMRALGANPVRKLVMPRILAAMITLPLLTMIADVIGIYGGLIVGVFELDISAFIYYRGILYTILIKDIIDGLAKSVVFGFLLSSIACYQGLKTKGGTEGVGRTTTIAVVISSLSIFISDYFMTKFLLLF